MPHPFDIHQILKVITLPAEPEANTLYLIDRPGNEYRPVVTADDGTPHELEHPNEGGGGGGATITITRTAGQAISGGRGIAIGLDGSALYADPVDVNLRVPIGIAAHAASLGEELEIQLLGEFQDDGWTWSPGEIFLTGSGILTQTPPNEGAIVLVGYMTAADSMRISPELVAVLG